MAIELLLLRQNRLRYRPKALIKFKALKIYSIEQTTSKIPFETHCLYTEAQMSLFMSAKHAVLMKEISPFAFLRAKWSKELKFDDCGM